MSIISKMERRSAWGRFVIGFIFLFLTVGGLTILYPFALMVSGSVRSEMDETELNFLPRYLLDTDRLYQKFLEYKYNQNVERMNRAHLSRCYRFNGAEPPAMPSASLVRSFEQFLEETPMPEHWYSLGGIYGLRTVPANARRYRERVASHFDHDFDRFRQETGLITDTWLGIVFPPPDWTSRQYVYDPGPLYTLYQEMLSEAPLAERNFSVLDGYFLESIIYPRYGRSTTETYNERNPGADLAAYADFVLTDRAPPPEQVQQRADWSEYVQEEVNPSFVVADANQANAFHTFLAERHGHITELNRVWGATYTAFEEIDLPDGGSWLSGAIATDYAQFIRTLPVDILRLTGPQWAWQDWLREHFETLAAANEALQIHAETFASVRIPAAQIEYHYVLEHAGALRRQFASQNYINVIDALFTHGRAFMNTVIYCILVVSLNLLINPMAAYALSRFKLKGTYKILLILMATSAFPPMVTLIPQFVILQNLNLMNTLFALLLPTLANGYLIFLLKGFFDSLPQDLYDAAMIDGASEIRVFFQITMALSKPILAVVALQSFNAAYTAFLYPLLVAPDPDMWLMSVWLYQFQQQSSMSGVFASVLIASIPTIVIFLFAQNIILRGIAVPVEK